MTEREKESKGDREAERRVSERDKQREREIKRGTDGEGARWWESKRNKQR